MNIEQSYADLFDFAMRLMRYVCGGKTDSGVAREAALAKIATGNDLDFWAPIERYRANLRGLMADGAGI